MKYTNIKILSLIPVELVDAENVNSVVIVGETFLISEVIRMAKVEAKALLNSGQIIYTPFDKDQLENIINHY